MFRREELDPEYLFLPELEAVAAHARVLEGAVLRPRSLLFGHNVVAHRQLLVLRHRPRYKGVVILQSVGDLSVVPWRAHMAPVRNICAWRAHGVRMMRLVPYT